MLLLAELERHVLSERQVAATVGLSGAEVTLPSWLDARVEFDAALNTPPEPESENAKLLRKLGV